MTKVYGALLLSLKEHDSLLHMDGLGKNKMDREIILE